MQRKTEGELQDTLEATRSMLGLMLVNSKGRTFRHKASGVNYVAIDVAYEEATLATVVVYHPLSNPVIRFTRPFREFQAKFEETRK